jgi:8-oxo-dGTP pyrophosphatase MutT (NUDIX family)
MNSPVARRRLESLLRGRQAHDAVEHSHISATLDWLASADDPFDRECTEPGHAVAGSWIVDPDRRRVVLIYHDELHRWLQPGGHGDPGEDDPPLIACRETREETGVAYDPRRSELLDIDVHEVVSPSEPAHLHFDFRFLVLLPEQPLSLGSDAEDGGWFTSAEVRAREPDAGMLRMLEKCRVRGLLD